MWVTLPSILPRQTDSPGPDEEEETKSAAVYQAPHHIQVEGAKKCQQ